MSRRSLTITDALHDYICQVGVREPALFARLREETAALPEARMQVAPEQGQFLALLVELLGAEMVIEIGTFTGYSALWMTQALPSHGRLVTCDVNAEWTDIAQRYWKEAGLSKKIELRLGPALETLDALLEQGTARTADLVFIDADKENVEHYYERALKLLRPGGLVAIDNVLWGGSVIDPNDQEPSTQALRQVSALLHDDERVTVSLVPIGDGLTLARKRKGRV